MLNSAVSLNGVRASSVGTTHESPFGYPSVGGRRFAHTRNCLLSTWKPVVLPSRLIRLV
jgi:hypothetical protein